jgi:hypothetical protein
MSFPNLTSLMGSTSASSAESSSNALTDKVNANAQAANEKAAENKMIADWQNEAKAAIQGAA